MILRLIAVGSSLHEKIQPSYLQYPYLSSLLMTSSLTHQHALTGSAAPLVFFSHQAKRIPVYLQKTDRTDTILTNGEQPVEECGYHLNRNLLEGDERIFLSEFVISGDVDQALVSYFIEDRKAAWLTLYVLDPAQQTLAAVHRDSLGVMQDIRVFLLLLVIPSSTP